MLRARLAMVVAIMGTFAACDPGGGDGDVSNEPPSPRSQTSTMRAAVLNDFSVWRTSPDEELWTVGLPRIEVGETKAGIFAIERPSVPPKCLVAAHLRLYLEEASELLPERLGIYPSHVFNALDKQNGDRFGYEGTALDVRPRATLDNSSSGWSEWDITDIVKLWLSREPFPSRGAMVPKKGPIVLTLRDIDGAPFATATVTSTEARDNRPHVIVIYREECSR